MSTARHHAEWLSLIETSGPFLSLPVLLETFPQGLDAVDPDQAAELRAAYEEWLDNQLGLAPERAIHTAWVQYVLTTLLGMDDDLLARDQAIPEGLKAVVAEHHETLRPDWVLREVKSNADYITRPLGPHQVTKRLYGVTRDEDAARPFIAHFLRLARVEAVKLQRNLA